MHIPLAAVCRKNRSVRGQPIEKPESCRVIKYLFVADVKVLNCFILSLKMYFMIMTDWDAFFSLLLHSVNIFILFVCLFNLCNYTPNL